MFSPSEAFLLAVSGTLGIYCEFVWPGRVFPGVTGAALTFAGTYILAREQLTPAGLMLVAFAAGLFLLEAFWRFDVVAGLLGTMCLSVGSILLVRGPAGIPPGLALPTCIVFGGVTIFLCRGAKRARRNKRSDVFS